MSEARKGATRSRPEAVKKAAVRTQPVAPAAEKASARAEQAKHRRVADMLRELRREAETLSANADRLLLRIS